MRPTLGHRPGAVRIVRSDAVERSAVTVDREHLQEVLDRVGAEQNVPGVVLGVFDGTQTLTVASGIANANTQEPMTSDTLFLIGSVTKVWVTTLVMTLVEAGEIEL